MKTVGVIGAGVSGLTAAYYLQNDYKVTVFEANSYIGGHTNTISLSNGLAVDTGFIVFNDKNYPNFCKLLKRLNVESQDSDMSFSYSSKQTNIAYSSDLPWGLFANKKQLFSLKYWRFLKEISRFNQVAVESVELDKLGNETIEDFLKKNQFSKYLVLNYIIPMGAAIWSASFEETLLFPAKSFLNFWYNHCLLQVQNRPTWKTVKGGSKTYVDALLKQARFNYYVNAPVQNIKRNSHFIDLYIKGQESQKFDYIILACHADQSLNLLEQPSEEEVSLLSKWHYSSNEAVLHTDTSICPVQRQAWASWMVRDFGNYQLSDAVSVTYWMNRLQSLNTPETYLVSLNCPVTINPNSIERTINYTHPIFNTSSLESQKNLDRLNKNGHTYYCGAYFGYGFHEDGVRSGMNVARALGVSC